MTIQQTQSACLPPSAHLSRISILSAECPVNFKKFEARYSSGRIILGIIIVFFFFICKNLLEAYPIHFYIMNYEDIICIQLILHEAVL